MIEETKYFKVIPCLELADELVEATNTMKMLLNCGKEDEHFLTPELIDAFESINHWCKDFSTNFEFRSRYLKKSI